MKLFDIYRRANLGAGKKSMAFSLTLSDPSAEVSAEQVERTVKKVLGNLKFKLGIEIRGFKIRNRTGQRPSVQAAWAAFAFVQTYQYCMKFVKKEKV